MDTTAVSKKMPIMSSEQQIHAIRIDREIFGMMKTAAIAVIIPSRHRPTIPQWPGKFRG